MLNDSALSKERLPAVLDFLHLGIMALAFSHQGFYVGSLNAYSVFLLRERGFIPFMT